MASIKLTNHTDVTNVAQGFCPPEAVRAIEIVARVDTGATMLALPADVVARLGLPVRGHRRVRLADGRVIDVPWVGGVLLEILGREMTCDALVMPTGTTALIGQIPLEELDLIVDPKTRELQVNPASPDAPLLDLLATG